MQGSGRPTGSVLVFVSFPKLQGGSRPWRRLASVYILHGWRRLQCRQRLWWRLQCRQCVNDGGLQELAGHMEWSTFATWSDNVFLRQVPDSSALVSLGQPTVLPRVVEQKAPRSVSWRFTLRSSRRSLTSRRQLSLVLPRVVEQTAPRSVSWRFRTKKLAKEIDESVSVVGVFRQGDG